VHKLNWERERSKSKQTQYYKRAVCVAIFSIGRDASSSASNGSGTMRRDRKQEGNTAHAIFLIEYNLLSARLLAEIF
jgi:hypothetical protein